MEMKRALVTGASEGIGRAFAQRLAADGYQITAVARSEARLKELTQELGSGHDYHVADLAKHADMGRIAGIVKTGKYDLLVNNAGVGVYGNFSEVDLNRLQDMVRLNCEAVLVLSHAFLQNSKKGDALINTSSTLAFLPMPMAGAYAASKAFVTSFSEALWYEQKKRGVYVMGLCPGVTTTNFHTRAGGTEKDQPPAAIAQTSEQVVAAALDALKKRKQPTVISGIKNFMMAATTRLMPRSATVTMMGRVRS